MNKRKARRKIVVVPVFQQSGFGYQVPPEFSLVLIYFNQKGHSQNALRFYKDLEKRDWKSITGRPIRNWKVAATDWIFDLEQFCKLRPLRSLKLYKEAISTVYKSKTRNQRSDVQQLKVQLEESNRRLAKARELLLTGDIEADDYRTIKSETEEKINRMEAKLTATASPSINIEPLLDMAITNISQLDTLYEQGTVTQQRKIVGSMFPEKLTFDGFQYRTTRVNEALRLMLLFDKTLQGKKNGTNQMFFDLSQDVIPLVLSQTL